MAAIRLLLQKNLVKGALGTTHLSIFFFFLKGKGGGETMYMLLFENRAFLVHFCLCTINNSLCSSQDSLCVEVASSSSPSAMHILYQFL